MMTQPDLFDGQAAATPTSLPTTPMADTATSGADARARIMERLRKLHAMTTENGATEEEALTAAQKAADLMAEHDLAYASIGEVAADSYGARTRDANGGLGRKARHEIWMATRAIASLFGCETWSQTRPDGGADVVYFGTAADTEAAHILRTMLCLAMERAFAAYMRSPERNRRRHATKERTDFMLGMAERITARLNEIVRERERSLRAERWGGSEAATTQSLVVATKAQVLAEKMAAHLGGRTLVSRSVRTRVRSTKASAAGCAAGARANLGVAALSGGVKMIGAG